MNKLTLLVILLLCNPITLYLLLGSFWTTSVILVIVFACYYLLNTYLAQPFVKVLFFNLLSLFSILYHAELIFSYSFPDWNIPNLYESKGNYYFNRPYLKEVFYTTEFNSIYRTNINGYRIANDEPCFYPTTSADILFIGDSFTQGAQVDYSEMFSSIVSDSLPNLKVVNAGISGAGIVDEFCYFMDRGRLLKPKYVVLEIGVFNDFMEVRERHANFNSLMIEHSNLYRYIFYNFMGEDDCPLGRWTEPIFKDEDTNRNLNILYTKTSPYKERDKKNFKEYLIKFKEECRKINCELIVVLLPSKEQISDQCFQEVIKGYGLNPNDFDLTYPNRWMNEVCMENSIELIDLFSDFKESGMFPFLIKDEHMNKTGHLLVGNKIVNHFKHNNNSFK